MIGVSMRVTPYPFKTPHRPPLSEFAELPYAPPPQSSTEWIPNLRDMFEKGWE